MSHIETGLTTLTLTTLAEALRQGDGVAVAQNPCLVLLRQAVALVAKEQQGSVGTTYLDYNLHPQAVNTNLALRIRRKLPRGIGLEIDLETGALTFKGDPWQVDKVFYAGLQQAIVQKYVVLAQVAALRRMHAQVSTQTIEDQVVITGVLHG